VIENWRLLVINDRDNDGWGEPAQKFVAFLTALSSAVAEVYGTGLIWHGPDMPDGGWLDPQRIERGFAEDKTRDEAGKALAYIPSWVVVQGFLDRGEHTDFSEDKWLVNVSGTAGGEPVDGTISVNAQFYVRKSARQLIDHDPDWLVSLLCRVAAAVSATRGRITTDGFLDAEVDADVVTPEGIGTGALSLAPHGVSLDPWPASLTAYPCPVGYPDGQVIVADLARFATDPASLIPDLATLTVALNFDA